VCKVPRHLPWKFSLRIARLFVRRLWPKFKGALLTITLLKDLVTGTWGPLLMICCYFMLVHVVRNRLVLILLKSVPSLISYDVICIETSTAVWAISLHFTCSILTWYQDLVIIIPVKRRCSPPHWWKPRRKRPIGNDFMTIFVLTSRKEKFVIQLLMIMQSYYHMTSNWYASGGPNVK